MAIVALAAIAVFYVYNPSEVGFFPKCYFKQLTGYQCPGCGGQRAIHALLHGHWADAFHFNALFVLSIPFLLWYVIKKPALPTWFLWTMLVVVLGFGVVRNLL